MAAKIWYLLDANSSGTPSGGSQPFPVLQDGGTPPSFALFTSTSQEVDSVAAFQYAALDYGTALANGNFSATTLPDSGSPPGTLSAAFGGPAPDSFVTPTPYTATFPAGNWAISVEISAINQNVANIIDGALNLGLAVWASTDPNGISPTPRLLSSSPIALTTASAFYLKTPTTATWSAPTITLAGEYLFFQFSWEITAQSSNPNGSYVTLNVDGANSFIKSTSLFSPTDIPETNFPSEVRRATSYVNRGFEAHPPQPERTKPIAAPVYADSVYRPRFQASSQLAEVLVIPDRTKQIAAAIFADMVTRPNVLVHQQAAFFYQPGEEKTEIASTSFPDRVDGPKMLTDQQIAATFGSPQVAPLLVEGSFPDTVSRLTFDVDDQAANASSVAPEEKVNLGWDAIFPDHVIRPTVPDDMQATAETANIVPEMPVDPSTTIFPDRVVRPFLAIGSQQAFTDSNVEPEQSLASTSFPHRVDRPMYSVTQQTAEFFRPPERTAPLAVVVAPDTVIRPAMLAANQMTFAMTVRPEELVQLDWDPVEYPERVTRPFYRVEDQAAFMYTQQSLAVMLGGTVFPGKIIRPTVRAQNVPAFFSAPMQEEGVGVDSWGPEFPDTVIRPFFGADDQMAFTDTTVILALIMPFVSFPDFIYRRPWPTLQMAFESPHLSLSVMLGGAVYVNRVGRPVVRANAQMAFTTSMLPEVTVPTDWEPEFQDTVVRPTYHVREQAAFMYTQQSLAVMLGGTVFPGKIIRPTTRAERQLAFTTSMYPEGEIAVDWMPSYPERVSRPFFLVTQQLAFVSHELSLSVMLGGVVYANRVGRPVYRVTNQMPFTISMRPEGEIAEDWLPSYPDRATRAWLPVADVPAFFPSMEPERSSTLATVVFPDRIVRPVMLTAHQLAASDMGPQPEAVTELDWDAFFPDRAIRARMLTAEYPFFASNEVPEREEVAFGAFFQDSVYRPTFRTVDQLASTPARVPEAAIAVALFPDRIERPVFRTAEQLAYVSGEERNNIFPLTPTSYPDAVIRPYVPVPDQVADFFTAINLPIGDTATFADTVVRPFFCVTQQLHWVITPLPVAPAPDYKFPYFPDTVYRPFISVANQLAVTNVYPKPQGTFRIITAAASIGGVRVTTKSAATPQNDSSIGGVPKESDSTARPLNPTSIGGPKQGPKSR